MILPFLVYFKRFGFHKMEISAHQIRTPRENKLIKWESIKMKKALKANAIKAFKCASGGNRTRTSVAEDRILSTVVTFILIGKSKQNQTFKV